MSHNYQYLHSEVRSIYMDLPVPEHIMIPQELMQEATRYASLFDAQSVGVKANFAYFMVPDSRGIPHLFFAKTAVKENSTNLAYYTQCAGWRFNSVYSLPDGALLPHDDFKSIFDFPFYSEAQVDAYASGKRDTAFGSGNAAPSAALPVTIAPEAIRAILHGVVGRWTLNTAPVYVEVPEGVDYNTYVMSAVKQIYSYFPVAFKTNVGFVSYLAPENASKYLRIAISFVPASRANSHTIRLDGSSAAAYASMCSVTFGSKMDAFLQHLAYLSDENERREFLETVLIDAEYSAADDKIGNIQTNRYTLLGDGLRIMKLKGDVQTLFSEWYGFVANIKKYPRGIARQICRLIDSRLNAESFGTVLERATAFPQPARIEEFRSVLEKLFFLCNRRPELYAKLWDYTCRVLHSGKFTDEACYDWLEANVSSMLKLTDQASFDTLKREFGSNCVARILKQAKEQILAGSLRNRVSYRESSAKIVDDAVSLASKYEDVTSAAADLRKLAEDRICEDVSNSLQALADQKVTELDQFLTAIKSCNFHMSTLAQPGIHAPSDQVRSSAEQYLTQLKEGYVAKVTGDAKQAIAKIKIDNRARYRCACVDIIEKAAETGSQFEDLTEWQQQMEIECEEKIADDVYLAVEKVSQKPIRTADEFRSAIETCIVHQKDLAPQGKSQAADTLRMKIDQYVSDLTNEYNTLMASVGMLLQSFQGKYFVGIDKYAERKPSLTEAQQKDVEDALNKLRPATLEKYFAQYRNQTGAELDGYALVREHSAASRMVADDLRNLLSKKIPVNFSGKSVAQIVEELDRYITYAHLFRTGKNVTVFAQISDNFLEGLNQVEMDAALLRDIITLNLEKNQTLANQEDTICAVVTNLHSSSIISAQHEYAIVEMLYRCGYKQAAARMMENLQNLNGTPIKESFRKEIENEAKLKFTKKVTGLRILAGVLGGLTVVSAAAIVTGCLLFNSAKKDLKLNIDELESTVEELENELSEAEELLQQQEEEITKLKTDPETILPLPSHEETSDEEIFFVLE